MRALKKINYVLAAFAALLLCFGIVAAAMPRASAAAAAPEIKPLVWYEFDDPDNMGKDSMGNFDLTPVIGQYTDPATEELVTCLTQQSDTDGSKYAQFVSNRGEDGQLSSKIGANLYAPRLGASAYDFSDLISGSFSVEITFRRDNMNMIGNHYVLACGKYNNAFQITPWKDGIEIQINHFDDAEGADDTEKQSWMEKNTIVVPWDTNEWTTLLVSADAETNTVNIYINGELKATRTVKHVEMTKKSEDYAFSIGAQCNINGGSQEGYSTVDIKDCKVFDCALSAANAQQLYKGETATYEGDYIDSVAELDTEALDLFVTDVNTVDNIMNNVLPKTMNVTLNTGVTIPANVWWIDRGEGQLYGYIQSDYANVKQLSVSAEYGYTVRFDYDESAVAVTGIKLDGQAYTPGTEISEGRHTVSFTITVLEGCELNDVYYYEISQFPLEDGGSDYSVTINNGGCIIIDAGETEYTVTYYDGEEKLFTSTYTVSGSEEAKTYEKEGYTFDGWYLDAGLTQKFTGFDRDNPTDLTLYAKTTQNATGGGDVDGGRGGCSGTVTAVSLAAGLPVLAGACVCLVLARKKRS